MDRRTLLKYLAVAPLLSQVLTESTLLADAAGKNFHRVRPSDPAWPTAAKWAELKKRLTGELIPVEFPLAPCQKSLESAACQDVISNLRNPYYVGDQPGLTQTLGWANAWTSRPSVYAVAATSAEDIAAAVTFAREHRLRLVVKGGGHSYQGTSNAPDSLLIWTRRMNDITMHKAFVPQGCERTHTPQPAVTMGAGAIWIHAYEAVTGQAGQYVQGGGCTTVGVPGLVQSGGFGSFSKRYGTAAAGLLEAEVITADGTIRIANACTHPDLFWALKGGGGGSFAAVSKVTLRVRELPEFFGAAVFTVKAASDADYRRLVRQFVGFYHDNLFNPHWGEQAHFSGDNELELQMVSQGLSGDESKKIWKPFLDWIAASPQAYTVERQPIIGSLPARSWWDASFMNQHHPGVFTPDNRPGAKPGDVWWNGDGGQVSWFIYAYESQWLPASLLAADSQERLAEALFASSRHWDVELHFNKGLAGAPAEDIAAARDTATNPAVVDAFALAIIGAGGGPAYPGIAGHEPDLAKADREAAAVDRAMAELRKVAPEPGSYVSESSFFNRSWRQAFWGSNYSRLRKVKKKYDPEGLFFVHHGVGSEEWSDDGFTRRA